MQPAGETKNLPMYYAPLVYVKTTYMIKDVFIAREVIHTLGSPKERYMMSLCLKKSLHFLSCSPLVNSTLTKPVLAESLLIVKIRSILLNQ